LRNELLAVTWLFATTVGVSILLWNRSFLGLWVGSQNYAGPWVNLLIVFIMAQTAFVRSDAYIIDSALQLRQRVLVTVGAAVLTIGLGILLTLRFGVLGLCAGILAGRLTQSIAYPHLVHRFLGVASPPSCGAAGSSPGGSGERRFAPEPRRALGVLPPGVLDPVRVPGSLVPGRDSDADRVAVPVRHAARPTGVLRPEARCAALLRGV